MEFTLKQLSWIVIGSLGIGSTGYINMTSKIEEMDKRIAVMSTQMDVVTKQLERIELKLERK